MTLYIDQEIVLFAGYYFSKEKTDNKYLAYLFRTDAWRSEPRSKVSGIKVFRISRRILGVATCIAPSEKEASQIVAYLDEKCAEIDRLIGTKHKFITKLESYKKSLIYEYVTGKKEASHV